MEGIKKILDSVHGYVEIPEDIVDNIIDSIYFQRLRRIEQTSGRSIFPSARHDRFIHSLGVYHLGTRIVDSVIHRNINVFPDFKIYAPVVYTYTLACLLHDVGHTPFSHTFEGYYNNSINNLKKTLIDSLKAYDDAIEDDIKKYWDDAAPHEIISALVSIKKFGDFISDFHYYKNHKVKGDVALLVRMIIGCKYQKDSKSFHNVFIELLHSKILDADGLDYICRDAWASGYLTPRVDINRLLDSITLYKNDLGQYKLCYDARALNEIRSALHVKNFQQENVINHHTVVYEQALLKRAMESVAYLLNGKEEEFEPEKRKIQLGSICLLDGFYGNLEEGNLGNYPTDDYFVCRMRAFPDNIYVKEWFSRKFQLFPLWKSRERFWYDFRKFNFNELTPECWLFSNHCKQYLSHKYNINIKNIWIENATPKNKMAELRNLNILINNHPISYTHLFSEEALAKQELLSCFKFIFLPKKNNIGEDLDFDAIRQDLVREFYTNIHV